MIARQRVVLTRRQYNQWVADQTLEDYALRFTAKEARRWSIGRVANTALGAISFLALEAIGGSITLGYGFENAVAAILVVAALIFLASVPIAFHAAKYGVDIDLLTRGAGFGYIGSTVSSLVYASFTFIFFAIESVILATALNLCFHIPLHIGYLLGVLVIIPIVTHGITLISRLQVWTQMAWAALQITPLAYIAFHSPESFTAWSEFEGHAGKGFDIPMFGYATAVTFSLIAQIGEQIDFLRFLPTRTNENRLRWWAGLIVGGPGWVLVGGAKLLFGSFLAVFLLSRGVSPEHAAEPTQMYLAAFQEFCPSPQAALLLTGVFVILSQIKINVTNAYAGSIAWSNFFSRLTHSHPGRVVWLVFNVAIALMLMEFGVYRSLEPILGFYSILAAAWVGTIVADLVVNKPLGFSPPFIEFRRAYLYDINPVGLGSMFLATLAAGMIRLGWLGETHQAFAPFLAFLSPFVFAPLIAWVSRGQFYLARHPEELHAESGKVRCCVCEYEFEPEDMAYCPAYAGHICSLCCSLDARCHSLCKPHQSLTDRAAAALARRLPKLAMSVNFFRICRYLSILSVALLVLGFMFYFAYSQASQGLGVEASRLIGPFLLVFVVMTLVFGVAAWLFVLAEESQKAAQEESNRQTSLLMDEIDAHRKTDAKLQKAKEVAEAANQAKTRFVVGISHELRAPLNAIFGYAQLMERDPLIPPHRQESVRVIRRSSEYLAALIEGVVDISKIEGGHLNLRHDEVNLADLLQQIVSMFRLQAQDKGIGFVFSCPEHLPAVVYTDEQRLRQILINLLSNALKFTDEGHIALRITYPSSQVAEFEIEDTGIGINPQDVERIFEPFERGHRVTRRKTPGIGLGLTITKSLTEILGGEISVSSELGKGSRFRVKLMLSEVLNPRREGLPAQRITGYLGRRMTVMVVDDDALHRAFVDEALSGLGFVVIGAPDGETCLAKVAENNPDLFLLDISMPGMDGWTLAARLRQEGDGNTPIVMVSADAAEYGRSSDGNRLYDDFLVKPVQIEQLVETIGHHLDLEWIVLAPPPAPAASPPSGTAANGAMIPPPRHYIDDLMQMAKIGYAKGLVSKLDDIERIGVKYSQFIEKSRAMVAEYNLKEFAEFLDRLKTGG